MLTTNKIKSDAFYTGMKVYVMRNGTKTPAEVIEVGGTEVCVEFKDYSTVWVKKSSVMAS